MDRRTLLGSGLALGLLGPQQALAQGAPSLRLGLITPPAHQWTQSAMGLADRLRASGLTLAVHPAGQLGAEAQMLQQLQTGALDLAFLTLGEFTNRAPDFGALTAPYLVRDIQGAQALLAGDVAQTLSARLAEFGLVGLGFGMAGMRQVLLSRTAPQVGDLAGRKIRTVPLAQELDFWEKLGTAPTPLPLPALYDALANGQIDGMQIDFEGTWNSRYFELAGEMLASDHMMFPMVAVASARRWGRLDQGSRAVLETEVADTLAQIRSAYEGIDAATRAQIEAAGFPVRTVGRDWFGGAVEAWYDDWRSRTPILADLEAEAARL